MAFFSKTLKTLRRTNLEQIVDNLLLNKMKIKNDIWEEFSHSFTPTTLFSDVLEVHLAIGITHGCVIRFLKNNMQLVI